MVMIRFGVWLVSCYAHVFVLISFVIVTLSTTTTLRLIANQLIMQTPEMRMATYRAHDNLHNSVKNTFG